MNFTGHSPPPFLSRGNSYQKKLICEYMCVCVMRDQNMIKPFFVWQK